MQYIRQPYDKSKTSIRQNGISARIGMEHQGINVKGKGE